MSEDTKQPGSEEPTQPGVSDSETSGTPPPSAIPPAGTLAGADEEKAAMVEQAKSRVAAVKESLAGAAGSDQERPNLQLRKKKKVRNQPTPAVIRSIKKLKSQFGEAIGDASEFIGQLSVTVDGQRIVEICDFLQTRSGNAF